ncbi:MAG: hypothetical protein N2Z74_03095 [Syntrophales bacterium]|nr:hypothetical protein [Syntrophales bacterium]
MPYYIALQYSAIQTTVLRHDRLWSIAGISQGLARLNEVELPHLVTSNGGRVLVAGGGKFTARFDAKETATEAMHKIRKTVATAFPMLEFQLSGVVAAADFAAAKEGQGGRQENDVRGGPDDNRQNSIGILEGLQEQKRTFRGHATSYLPHLAVCDECGEYPAETSFSHKEDTGRPYLCRTCHEARRRAWTNLEKIARGLAHPGESPPIRKQALTTLERIYQGYLSAVPAAAEGELPLDFSDMFPPTGDADKASRQRMAVWFSDLNNMNQKVPIWLAQPEDEVLKTFDAVKEVNIAVIVKALHATFPKPSGQYLPFRLVVAGGDDLCLVMPEEYILAFVLNLAQAVEQTMASIEEKGDNPLSVKWLRDHADPRGRQELQEIKPYSFGGAFVIAPLHTPFRKIHTVGEELMGTAKKVTDRWGNSVNWRIMAEDQAVTEHLFSFERPVFITAMAKTPERWPGYLTFKDYMDLRKRHTAISSSHRFAIVSLLQEFRNDRTRLATALKKLDGATRSKSFSALLDEEKLKREGHLDPARFATLLELLTIKSSGGDA